MQTLHIENCKLQIANLHAGRDSNLQFEIVNLQFCNPAPQTNHDTLSLRRILVTGGAGFLGSFVIEKLRARGYSDIIVPRRPSMT